MNIKMLKEGLLTGLMTAAMTTALASNSNQCDVNSYNPATYRSYVPGEVIVKFKDNSGIRLNAPQKVKFKSSGVGGVDKTLAALGVENIEELMPLTGAREIPARMRDFKGRAVNSVSMAHTYRLQLLDNTTDVQSAIQALEALDEVEYAEPNFNVYSLDSDEDMLPDDPYYSMQYAINDVNLYKLWGMPVISKDGPVIAIIDTGVDISHPDLQANIWVNPSEISGASGYDDDRNGYIDDLHGWDFINNTGTINDYNGHGTHCAGIAGATGYNGIGIIGANPFARIMPLTVLQSDGTGDIATIVKALDYAIANGADILSMSLGTYAESQTFEQALGRAYQKSLLVAAAGNDGMCLNHAHPEKGQAYAMPQFPAAYTFVLGVQASQTGGNMASFSNYDDDGPTYSGYGESKLYNYEIMAPGVSIISTYPGGRYKQLNGTSMATPLVAGALSRLLQAKNYDSRELLFGDLINSMNSKGVIDFFAAYNMADADRHPELQLVGCRLDDSKAGDADGRMDANETLYLYPTFRNTWGNARNITYTLCLDELEDQSIADFPGGNQALALSALSSYSTAEAVLPIAIHINPACADGRKIKFRLYATCDNSNSKLEQELIYTVENGVELGGVITGEMTLTPDKNYIISSTLAVADGASLTILPGTTIKMKDYTNFSVSSQATFNCIGEPGRMITFMPANGSMGFKNRFNFGGKEVKYATFTGFGESMESYLFCDATFYNCYFTLNNWDNGGWCNNCKFKECTLSDNSRGAFYGNEYSNCNLVNNGIYWLPVTSSSHDFLQLNLSQSSNILCNYDKEGNQINGTFAVNTIQRFTPEYPNYLGSALEANVRPYLYDIYYPGSSSLGEYDLSNMLTRPSAQAHGMVWKVVVNGYDAQDEFDLLPPLGVGRHKFEVYFNRKMNHEVAPSITMGVRIPYTQTAIAEDGEWSTVTFDGEEVDVYTAYLTISGRSDFDGYNRICVTRAEDDEFFKIPEERTRFNVNVQAAGSLSDGFMAEAGLGRVNLEWESPEENFNDMLGYNMYRYTVAEDGSESTHVRINTNLIEPETVTLTDYDVKPGITYCYYYKVMRTNMTENSPSKTVAVTPLTSVAGDANGSGAVDVADVITTVNYAAGMNPQPFIFEAADINTDTEIDILDVVGIIRAILHPESRTSAASAASAVYYIEDGNLYVDSSVAIAGVQITVAGTVAPTAGAALEGFEVATSEIGESRYLAMAYSLSGRNIAPGNVLLFHIGDSALEDIRMSDTAGHNIEMVATQPTGIIGITDSTSVVRKGIYNLTGVMIDSNSSNLNRLPAGFYIVDGKKVIKR